MANRELAEDIAEEFGTALPGDKFSGTTVENARVSLSSPEIVDLIEKVLDEKFLAQQ